MEQFLLLGQIPGTTIQISFGDWLLGAFVITSIVLVRFDRKHQHQLLFTVALLWVHFHKQRQLKYFDQIAL